MGGERTLGFRNSWIVLWVEGHSQGGSTVKPFVGKRGEKGGEAHRLKRWHSGWEPVLKEARL